MLTKTFTVSANGHDASLHAYIQYNSPDIRPGYLRPLVVVCPGGGYILTSDREAEPVALALLARGFNVCVLRYSVAPAEYPTALAQLAEAMLLVRQNAAAWQVDEERIHVMGFSAGGHLAASLATLWQAPELCAALPGRDAALWRPRSAVLCYPVITAGEFAHQGSHANLLGSRAGEEGLLHKLSLENSVGPQTVPCFLWHTAEDASVPVENSLLFAAALRRSGVPFELHVYPNGAHGLSLATVETVAANRPGWGILPEVQGWIELAARWLRNM